MIAANSCILLTDSLPPASMAAELLKQLPKHAPQLVQYFDQCQSTIQSFPIHQSRCVAEEAWQIEQGQWHSAKAKHNAALALLLAQQQQKSLTPAHKPFWLVELVHIAPARDGAALIPASDLHIDQAHSQQLLQSAQSLCEGTPFQLQPWSTTHWQLHTNIDLPAHFASSALVSRTAVNAWWDQDHATRDWRRFVNELQMLYFDHPVNQQRQSQGLAAVNSLWPLGGLAPSAWQADNVPLRLATLSDAALRQDWGLWLHQLQELEKTLMPLLAHSPTLVLSNLEHIMTLTPATPRFWQRFFPSTPTWRNHWLAQS